jgi:hypothetical protein
MCVHLFCWASSKQKQNAKMYPSVNNGIAGIPENRLGFVGEATYLPHLHIGAIRKGRPFFWQFLNTPWYLEAEVATPVGTLWRSRFVGANGMHFKFIFHRGETHFFLFTHTEDPRRVVVDTRRYIGARLGL